MLAGFPQLNALSYVISRSNSRRFTYKEDALSGISRLISLLSRSFTHGFLYGLPKMFFEQALGWRAHIFTDIDRRHPSNKLVDNLSTRSLLPSWSWVGWKGDITVEHNQTSPMSTINSDRVPQKEMIPITTWFTL